MSGIATGGGGGDGDALLAGGTTANPQIFTGVNEFNGATNGNVGLIEQTATTSNTFIQTSGATTNFIRQNGTRTGFIIQEADDSGIRQDGDNAEIKQAGDNADFRQQGTGCGIRQSGANAIITQSGLNSVISSPRVRCNNLPVIGNDLCNKTYVDSVIGQPRAGDIVNRQLTFFNTILSVNTANSGYSYVDEMEVGFTPTYTNSHFKITMNCHYGSQSQDRMIWVAIRLYRNFAHLTAASSIETPGNANAAAWVTHNARTLHTSQNHNNQMSGLFIDTNPSLHTDGKIYYAIAIRPVAINTTSGGASANVFRMNTTYSTTNTPKVTSQMLIEEIFVS